MVNYELGTVAASEAIIKDLYVNLRTALFNWSSVTHQTPHPRMGYVGQHLVSVVTGFPGGRSGARGKDLVLPGGRHAEIKTCYRVDQLGTCLHCKEVVASIEKECPNCGSTRIARKDDSKWLVSPKHDDELRDFFTPEAYYLVLFDFEDLSRPENINARIWSVDPRSKGFSYCMIDYYFNIKAASRSGAPFNLWPFMLKFQLMEPCLIYHAKIATGDDSINTLIFPGERGKPMIYEIDSLETFARSSGMSDSVVKLLARRLECEQYTADKSKKEALRYLQEVRVSAGWSNADLADAITESLYGDAIANYRKWLPLGL